MRLDREDGKDWKAKNQLINFPIQATGVDLFKLASDYLYQELCRPEFADFKFLLSLHDSMLFEVPKDRAEECKCLVESAFDKAASRIFKTVPCKTDIKIGTNWAFLLKGEVTA